MQIVAYSAGSISRNELLTLDEVQRRLGIGSAAMRSARRDGLPVRYVGRRGFVSGDDLIQWVKSHGRNKK